MKYEPLTIARARELRRNMPPAERKLWHAINYGKMGVKFRKQQPVGSYFVDFVCHEIKLVIELDGQQHGTEEALRYDNRRTDFIKSQGYEIIRIPNGYIYKEFDSVINHLQLIINGNIGANEYFKSKYDL